MVDQSRLDKLLGSQTCLAAGLPLSHSHFQPFCKRWAYGHGILETQRPGLHLQTHMVLRNLNVKPYMEISGKGMCGFNSSNVLKGFPDLWHLNIQTWRKYDRIRIIEEWQNVSMDRNPSNKVWLQGSHLL